MLESVRAAPLLGPGAGIHRLDAVLAAGFAVMDRRCVVPVGGGHVIAVGTVLRLHFPVSVVVVGGCPPQHLQPFGCLIDDHVDDLGGLAEVFGQRNDVRIDAAEQEAAIILEGPDLDQVVAAVAVEGLRITGVVDLILDFQQLALVVEGPAVEGTRERRLVALLVTAKRRPAVGTCVHQRIEFAILAASDDDRLPPDVQREIVIDVRNLGFVGEIDPVALEDVFHLQLEQFLIGKHAAVQAKLLRLRIVLQRRLQLGDSRPNGRLEL